MAVRTPLVNVMARAAEKAAKGLLRDFGEVEQLQVSRKGPADFVSNADLNAQKIIHAELQKARPDFGFLMEEKGQDVDGRPWRWIVDPLDGTTNFLHGLPFWSIAIAAEHEGQVVAGVVFEPVRNELFWAERGMGAFTDKQRLRVSARTELADAVVATGFPFKGRIKPGFYPQLQAIVPQVAGLRRLGSAALDLAYVAAGRFDAYWETGLGPWDCAAGCLLVSEAGGRVAPLIEGQSPHLSGAVIATNQHLHEQIATLIRTAE